MEREEAIEVVKKNYPYINESVSQFETALRTLIPELAESEDERIRKHLIKHFGNKSKEDWNGVPVKSILAWLGKRGEQKPNPCENCGIATNNCQKFPCTIRDGERKPADNIEPKFNFKVNQWIVATGKCVYLIAKIDGFNVTLVDTNGDEYVFDTSLLNDAYEWTIQDAKAGDVLVNKYGCILIFKDRETCWCYYSISSEVFRPNSNRWFFSSEDYLYPATKEQRDLLFQKMHEAGYEWDTEKLELRKIEQKTSECRQDNVEELTEFENVMMHIGDSFFGENAGLDPNDTNVIKEQANLLLELVPKQEWSEEDEDVINHLLAICAGAKRYRQFAGCLQEDITKYQTWLKSLKDRYTWKPSDGQMNILFKYAEQNNRDGSILTSLYQDLKKLREKM